MITKSRGFISLAGVLLLSLLVTSLTATVVLVKNPNISLDLRNWAAESCSGLSETGCNDLAGCIWNPEKIVTSTTKGTCEGVSECIEYRTKQGCGTYGGCVWEFQKTTVPASCSGTPTSNASPSPRAACGTEGDACCARRCNAGLVCSSIDGGTCMPQVCTPAEQQCTGSTAKICKGDGSGWTNSNCQFGCKPGTSSCYACKPGSTLCAGDNIMTCNSEGTDLVKSACGTNKTCDANLGRCVNKSGACMDPCDNDLDCGSGNYCDKPSGACPICRSKGSLCTPSVKQCSGIYLQTCNTSGTAWISANCGTPGCNSTTKACNVASPSPSADSNTCSAGQVKCTGNGQILGCRNGYWYPGTACSSKTCNATGTDCGAVVKCTAGETRCRTVGTSTMIETCTSTGSWGGKVCSGTCSNGVCTNPNCANKPDVCNSSGGVNYCVNGTYYSKTCATGSKCSGGTCIATVATITQSDCDKCLLTNSPSECSGACKNVGQTYSLQTECTTGQKTCSGNTLKSCSSSGTWSSITCSGSCDPVAKACNPTITKRCGAGNLSLETYQNGQWSSQMCPGYCDSTTLSCVDSSQQTINSIQNQEPLMAATLSQEVRNCLQKGFTQSQCEKANQAGTQSGDNCVALYALQNPTRSINDIQTQCDNERANAAELVIKVGATYGAVALGGAYPIAFKAVNTTLSTLNTVKKCDGLLEGTMTTEQKKACGWSTLDTAVSLLDLGSNAYLKELTEAHRLAIIAGNTGEIVKVGEYARQAQGFYNIVSGGKVVADIAKTGKAYSEFKDDPTKINNLLLQGATTIVDTTIFAGNINNPAGLVIAPTAKQVKTTILTISLPTKIDAIIPSISSPSVITPQQSANTYAVLLQQGKR